MKKQRKSRLDRLDPEVRALVEARLKSGFTRTEMAKRAGVSYGPIVNFEKGLSMQDRMRTAVREAYEDMAALAIVGLRNNGITAEWLRRQTESFLKVNALGIVEKGGQAHFVISSETVYRFGKTVLLATGKNID